MMRQAVPMLCLCMLLLGSTQGALVFRHQFQFKLKGASPANITAVLALLKALPAEAPKAAKPLSAPVGPDLGIATKLYTVAPGGLPVQADVAGFLNFDSEAAMRAYFAYTATAPKFAQLMSYVAGSARLQYVVDSCTQSPPPKGTIRHSFMYRFNNNTLDVAGQARLVLSDNVARNPTKPLAYAMEADLGIGPSLYTSPAPNYVWGGFYDFKNLADAQAWWKWLLALPEYKTLVASVGAVSRIQYNP